MSHEVSEGLSNKELEFQNIMELMPTLTVLREVINKASDNLGRLHLDRPIFTLLTRVPLLAALLAGCASGKEVIPPPREMPAATAGAYFMANEVNEDNTVVSPSVQATYDAMNINPEAQEAGPENSEAEQTNVEVVEQTITVQDGDNGVFDALTRAGYSEEQMRVAIVVIYRDGVPLGAYDFDHLLEKNPTIQGGDNPDQLVVLASFDNADYRLPSQNIHITP